MAAFLYNKHRERHLSADFDWQSATVKLMFVSGLYSPSEDDEFVSDIPAGAILARSDALGSKSITDGFAAGLGIEFLLFRSQVPVAGYLLYEDTGDDSTSKLIGFSNEGPAFPFTAVGFNYAVSYNALEGGFYRA